MADVADVAKTELTDTEIIEIADVCAKESDHNQPGKISSHSELMEMAVGGMSILAKNKEFTDYIRKVSVAN